MGTSPRDRGKKKDVRRLKQVIQTAFLSGQITGILIGNWSRKICLVLRYVNVGKSIAGVTPRRVSHPSVSEEMRRLATCITSRLAADY
jgi:hypothetical protein